MKIKGQFQLFFKSIFHFFIVTISIVFNSNYAKNTTIFAQVMESNLASLKHIDDEWPTEEYYAYIDRCMKTQLEWKEYKKRQVVFQLFDSWAKKNLKHKSSICDDPITWKDLNLFCGQSDLQSYFANKIDRTNTIFGKITLFTHLVQPITDIQELEKRQRIIKYLVDHPDLLNELDASLKTIAESENMFLSFWAKDELKEFAMNYRYLQWPWKKLNDSINSSEIMLTGVNSVMHYLNILWINSLIIGVGALLPISTIKLFGNKIGEDNKLVKWANDVNEEQVGGFLIGKLQKWTKEYLKDDAVSPKILNILGILAGIYAGLSIKEYVNWTRAQFAVESCLHAKMIHVSRVTLAIKKLNDICKNHGSLQKSLLFCHNLSNFFDPNKKKIEERKIIDFVSTLYNKKTPEYHKLSSLLWYSTIKGLTFSKGNIFVNYKLMNEYKACFEDALVAIGEVDMYVSLAKLYKEHQDKKARYSFAEFKENKTPLVKLYDFWNPFIDANKVVTNTLELGTQEMPRNMIITGPNAGGKSTILKACALSLLMAQSFGIAPATKIILTPFSRITTYLNIADDIGAGKSLFKAQAFRAQQLLDNLEAMKPGEFGFMIVDEMFNGTSPKEAEASAFSVAKSIGEHPHGMCIIATHYPLLTYLGYESSDFINFNVSVNRSGNGNISYPFKLRPGISDQHVAIEILRSQGFNGSILDNAETIIKDPTCVERAVHEMDQL